MLSIILWQSGCRRERLSNTPPASNENAAGGQLPAIKIRSTLFQDGEMIPRPYTCDGPNVSPSLAWESVPPQARTLALIADDPDAPARTWVHWVLYNLPAETKGLVENVQKEKRLAGGAAVQGINDFQKIGYDGPCPPSGTHRYYFKLYALDTELPLEPGATKEQLLEAMKGHVLAEGQLMCKYHR
ncbi:MAG TPA: YbhB/YbcL family Raf kinase inhibitor-like protein [Pyrinomonadaceae bacterium]|jgi:Raf kinase inhibitor-like YbhB/YbcL family protein